MPVLLDETPAQFRLTQRSTDAQQVTRTSTRAQDCPASINFAKNGEADYDRGVLCRVAPGELQPESSGSASHAPEEVVKPLAGAGGRQPQCQKETLRPCPHCRDVARSPGQSLVSHDLRRVRLPKKMN